MTRHAPFFPHTSVATPSTLACTLALTGMLLNPVLRPLEAQDTRSRADARAAEPRQRDLSRLPELFSVFLNDDKRAVLGVTLGATGPADTLGVLVESVAPGGPADRAGLKGGTRITAVNGTSTRLSSGDAGDPDLEGVARRRLQRVLAKAAPGDDVELRVTSDGGQPRTIRVKTVSAADLNQAGTQAMASTLRAAGGERRASLGVSVGSSGNPRDTLGLFISSVVSNGPAEKAGIVEGERIAAINSADVRVPREDAEDAGASMARVNRFLRELGKAAPGDKITLRVYGNGRYRDVTVTAGNSAESMGFGFRSNFGDGYPELSIPHLLNVPGTVNRLPMPSRVPNGVILRRGGGTVKA